jgi:hypothetical protein
MTTLEEQRERLEKDPSVQIVSNIDAKNFVASTRKETLECIYVKLVELDIIMKSCGATDPKLVLAPEMAEYFPPNIRLRETGRHFLGNCNSRWHIYQDSDFATNLFEIESSIGKVVLIVMNLEGFDAVDQNLIA